MYTWTDGHLRPTLLGRLSVYGDKTSLQNNVLHLSTTNQQLWILWPMMVVFSQTAIKPQNDTITTYSLHVLCLCITNNYTL